MNGFIIDIKAVFIQQQTTNAIFHHQVPFFSKLKTDNLMTTGGCR